MCRCWIPPTNAYFFLLTLLGEECITYLLEATPCWSEGAFLPPPESHYITY